MTLTASSARTKKHVRPPRQPNAAGLGQGELELLTLPNPPEKA